jgi:hypothetical protein
MMERIRMKFAARCLFAIAIFASALPAFGADESTRLTMCSPLLVGELPRQS